MSDQHHYLPITKIQPGMILANDLLDKQGQILLPVGVTITKQMLASLLLHDIHQLSVMKAEIDSTPFSETQSEDIQQRLDIIFRHGPFEDTRNSLARLITKYRLGDTA